MINKFTRSSSPSINQLLKVISFSTDHDAPSLDCAGYSTTGHHDMYQFYPVENRPVYIFGSSSGLAHRYSLDSVFDFKHD